MKKIVKVLTRREEAVEKAKKLLVKRNELLVLTEEIAAITCDLETYYKETRETDFEVVTVSIRKGAAKIVGATGKALDLAKRKLMDELDAGYLKKGLDMTAIEAMCKSDNALIGALSKYGLSVEVGEDAILFREQK